MIEHADGFEFDGLYCYPAEEPETYYFLPLTPRPETDAHGAPTLMSIPMGEGGFLQFGTRLEADEARLAALRQELARRHGLDDPARVRLKMAPLEMQGAALLIGDGGEMLEEVARSSTSGFPPYAALFHQQLDAAQQNAVVAAMNGRGGFVKVRYDINLPKPVTARACLEGDMQTLLARLANVPAEGDLEALAYRLLDEAVAAGLMVIEADMTDEGPADLLQRVVERVREQAVEWLLTWHRGAAELPDVASATTSAELTDLVDRPLQLTTDLADWFAPGEGMQHLKMLPPKEDASPRM